MSSALVQSLLGALPQPALAIDETQRICAANAQAQALLGPQIVGRSYVAMLRQPALLDAIEQVIATSTAREARYLGDQDTLYAVSCRPAQDMIIVSFDDVTHRSSAEQMRRDFVANVSHELRTPLTALLGFIETLRGPARADPKAQERFLGIMQAEAERMNRLVGDLLSLSRLEGEERVRPSGEVDLRALLGGVAQSIKPLADEAGVALNTQLGADAVRMMGDADQLRQLFTNLIENAIKYGGAGGHVWVEMRALARDPSLRGPAVHVAVRDAGPGIDPVHLPRLTERFYRADSHRSRALGGTGLGLAIVKHITARHRGRLRIDSTLGQGATFTVILPMMPDNVA